MIHSYCQKRSGLSLTKFMVADVQPLIYFDTTIINYEQGINMTVMEFVCGANVGTLKQYFTDEMLVLHGLFRV